MLFRLSTPSRIHSARWLTTSWKLTNERLRWKTIQRSMQSGCVCRKLNRLSPLLTPKVSAPASHCCPSVDHYYLNTTSCSNIHYSCAVILISKCTRLLQQLPIAIYLYFQKAMHNRSRFPSAQAQPLSATPNCTKQPMSLVAISIFPLLLSSAFCLVLPWPKLLFARSYLASLSWLPGIEIDFQESGNSLKLLCQNTLTIWCF